MTKMLDLLQEHYDDPYHRGVCETATHGAEANCDAVSFSDLAAQKRAGESDASCRIGYSLAISDDGQVQEAWFEADGCVVCEGLASIVAESIEGMNFEMLKQLCAQDLLKRVVEKTRVSERDFLEQEIVSQPCAMLPFEALSKTLKSPLVELDEDLADGSQFGGPSLREEC